ncbi:MAG: phosphotransferase family protein, partial [Solirubrobacteraceae bacterium]
MASQSDAAGAPALVRSPAELDVAWLAAALDCGPIAAFSAEPIGTGQMSESHRLTLTYADPAHGGPPTVVLKLAAEDAGSRATGVGLGIYEREVRFYNELAPRIGGPLADCSFADYDETEGRFTLLLQDVAPATVGDQIAGCSQAQARAAVEALARLHAPVLDHAELAACAWLNRPSPIGQALVSQLLPGFLQRYGERIDAEQRALCERLVASLDDWLAERNGPQGLVHGDYRLDNLLFGQDDAPRALTVVDWQTVGWGNAMTDLSYFLGGGLRTEDRRLAERELVGAYRDALAAHGAQAPSWELCWREYRRLSFAGMLMAIVASMLVERTERGDEMFMTMLERHSRHALDLDAVALLAPLRSGPAPALRPAPTEEGRHAPGSELLWNESWYFDAIARDGSIGAYVRVGLYPQLGVCWYTALVCGADRETVAAIDYAAPLPTGDQLDVHTDSMRAEHRCERPLET